MRGVSGELSTTTSLVFLGNNVSGGSVNRYQGKGCRRQEKEKSELQCKTCQI